MKEANIRAYISKDGNRFVIQPATNADSVILTSFAESCDNKVVTLSAKDVRGTKNFSQLKTAYALIDCIYISIFRIRPTKSEREQLHDELLDEYAPRKPALLGEGTVPMTLREMSVSQLAAFVQSLIMHLGDSCDLPFDMQSDVKDIFTEWQDYQSSLDRDPGDYDEDGNLLPLDVWRERHTVSFASGLGGCLDMAHIISRGADTRHRGCAWNVMMLTHEEHMKQHQIGWDSFLEIYPHLRGRVERARRLVLEE